MGIKDKLITRYLSEPGHFTDFINGTLFQGRQILNPKTIIPISQRKVAKTFKTDNSPLLLDGTRDVVMKQDFNGIYAVFATEIQSEIHYGMPVRNLGYDAADYLSQIKTFTKENRQNKTYTNSAEFLSGIKAEDRLTPVFNLVFYYGEDTWNAPLNLKSMMDIPPELKPYEHLLPDYRVTLIQPAFIEPENFQGDWKMIFSTLKHACNGTSMENYLDSHHKEFQNMEEDSIELLWCLLHELDTYRKIKADTAQLFQENQKEESYMCIAFDEIRAKYRNLGHEQAQSQLLSLISLMEKDGKIQELPRLSKEPEFLSQMLKKYHLETM